MKLVEKIANEFRGAMGRQQPSAIAAMIDAKYQGTPEERAAMRTFMATHCANCLRNSKAVVQHSRAQCRQDGNRPANPCPKCAQRGVVAYHWMEDCTA